MIACENFNLSIFSKIDDPKPKLLEVLMQDLEFDDMEDVNGGLLLAIPIILGMEYGAVAVTAYAGVVLGAGVTAAAYING
jgi:hypothetical protein